MFDSGGLGDAGARARSAPAITATADAGAPSRAGARCASRALPVIELAFARLLTRAIALDLDTWPRHASTHGHGSTNDAVHSPAEAAGLTRADSATAADAVAAADRPAATDSRTAAEGPTATDGPAATEGSAGGDALVLGKAAALVGSDLAHASDDDLVDAVVAWQHVASWAAAAQARLVGELLARGGSSSRAADAVVHELSAALVTSRRTAAALVGRATGLGAVPQVADALADGRIDCARADVLTSYENVPVAVRDRVAVQLVGTRSDPGPATGLTPAQLRDRLRRAAIETNPEDAVKRAEAAAGGRHVWIDPAPDQMAWLTALLPAADAARAWARIDGAARTVVRTPGDTRTLAQARADALTDLLAGSVPLDTALPTSTNAADPHGARPPAGDPSVRSAVRTVVNVTIAASTLLGIDESPADLGGYGPIPAPLARGLATDPDATWRRILTDPATGIATDVSRTAYRPGLVLGDLVRTTHAMCTFPGCRVPAARCDLDHIDPFDAGRPTAGQTRADNLHPVCRAHHNAKTHGGWTTRREPDGAITWTAPSGHAYTVAVRATDPTVHVPPPTQPPPTQPSPPSPPSPGRTRGDRSSLQPDRSGEDGDREDGCGSDQDRSGNDQSCREPSGRGPSARDLGHDVDNGASSSDPPF
jgi:hypothetical protein